MDKFDKSLRFLLNRIGIGSFISSSDIKTIIKAILDRLKETKPPKYIDRGSFAFVFWLQKNRKRILKITTDREDAYAMQRLLNSPQRHLIKVYDVFEIIPNKLWGIVSEKLMPLDESEFREWEDFWFALDSDLLDGVFTELKMNGLSVSWVEDFIKEVKDPPYTELTEEDEDWNLEYYMDLPDDDILDALKNWGKELSKLSIRFFDLHPGNIMVRRGDYILVDLGYGEVPHTNIEKLSVQF